MKYHIAICVPSNGTWHTDFGFSLANLSSKFNDRRIPGATSQKISLFSTMGSMLSQSRELLAEQALKSGCTHILWLDSDMQFPWDILHQMLALRVDFVAANCTTKQIPAQPTAKGLGGEVIYTDLDSKGVDRVSQVGLAVCLMKTRILKDLPHPWFPMSWDEKIKFYSGEDVAFCKGLLKKKVTLYISHEVSRKINHIGTFAYNHEYVGDVTNDRSSAA